MQRLVKQYKKRCYVVCVCCVLCYIFYGSTVRFKQMNEWIFVEGYKCNCVINILMNIIINIQCNNYSYRYTHFNFIFISITRTKSIWILSFTCELNSTLQVENSYITTKSCIPTTKSPACARLLCVTISF